MPYRTQAPTSGHGQPELLPKRNDLLGNLHVFAELPVKNLLTNPLSVHPASLVEPTPIVAMLIDGATPSVWFGGQRLRFLGGGGLGVANFYTPALPVGNAHP